MEHEVRINRDLCIGCGSCERDCTMKKIEVKEGKAELNDRPCISCGHCLSVCPAGAVELTGFNAPLEDAEEIRLNPEELLKLMRNRRSIRQFQERKIDPKALEQILEAGRLSHTGKNAQDCTFYVLQDRIDEAEQYAVNHMRRFLGDAITDHFFFFRAPLVIVITSSYAPDGILAAQNMEFLAEANGIGTLFCGYFTEAANTCKELKELFHIDRSRKVVMTLVMGYPDVQYRKIPPREPLNAVRM